MLPVRFCQKFKFVLIKILFFTQKSRDFISDINFIKESQGRIIYNSMIILSLYWSRVSVAANGFQKFANSLLKMEFLPNFNTTAPV